MASVLSSQIGSSNMSRSNGEISVGELLVSLGKQWRVIIGFVCVGIMLSVAFIYSLPDKYKAEVVLTIPNNADVEAFNANALLSMDRNGLFSLYLERLESVTNFFSFLEESKLLEVYAQRLNMPPDTSLKNEIIGALSFIKISQPVGINDAPLPPHTVKLSMLSSVEDEILFNTLGKYRDYINSILIEYWEQEIEKLKTERLLSVEKQISELRNRVRLERLQKIEFIENQHNLRTNELELEKQLLKELEQRNRKKQIAEATEAMKIATALGISKPKTLEAFSRDGIDTVTSVSLSSQSTLPLYLMGTEYLASLVETLKSREDDLIFISEIGAIDKELKKIKEDPQLKALKNRTTDDPFISELPNLLSVRDNLTAIEVELDDVSFYSKVQDEYSYKVNNTNKKLVILVSFISISVLLAFVFAVLKVSIERYVIKSKGALRKDEF